MQMPIRRDNLTDGVADAMRAMIVDGRFAPGERLNEVHLAERLGVSRTPLREALNRLVAEGAVEARPRLGYFVKPLSSEELDQLYDLRPILDPAALLVAGIPHERQLTRLEALNAKLLAERRPERAIALDDAWHLELLAHCRNRALIALIEGAMTRTRRYELALMREAKSIAAAGDAHADIMAALHARDLEAACAALKANLEAGKAPIMAWLAAREAAAKIKRGQR
jgi:DNA-binding GntR family transcriptional regulator